MPISVQYSKKKHQYCQYVTFVKTPPPPHDPRLVGSYQVVYSGTLGSIVYETSWAWFYRLSDM